MLPTVNRIKPSNTIEEKELKAFEQKDERYLAFEEEILAIKNFMKRFKESKETSKKPTENFNLVLKFEKVL